MASSLKQVAKPQRIGDQRPFTSAVVGEANVYSFEEIKARYQAAGGMMISDVIVAFFDHSPNPQAGIEGREVCDTHIDVPSFLETVLLCPTTALNYMNGKIVEVRGPQLGDLESKQAIIAIHELREVYFAKHGDLKVKLVDLVRAMACGHSANYPFAFRTLVKLFAYDMQIHSSSKKDQMGLGEWTPFLTFGRERLLQEMKTALTLHSERKVGTALIEPLKGIELDLNGSALHQMLRTSHKIPGYYRLGGASNKFGSGEITNLTWLLDPRAEGCKNLSVSSIRLLAALIAFAPYDDKKGRKGKGKGVNPIRTLNAATLAAVAGRAQEFKVHAKEFIERVVRPIAAYVGEIFCDAKTNFECLYHYGFLAPIGNVRAFYEKVRKKFRETARLGVEAFKKIMMQREERSSLPDEQKDGADIRSNQHKGSADGVASLEAPGYTISKRVVEALSSKEKLLDELTKMEQADNLPEKFRGKIATIRLLEPDLGFELLRQQLYWSFKELII